WFRHPRPACGDAVQDSPLPPSRLGPDSESFASRSEVRRIVSAVAPLVAALAGGSPTQSPSLASSLCACGRESSCAARRSSPRSSSSCASRPVHRRQASCCQWDSECSFPPRSYPPASVVLPRSRALVPIPSAAGANSGSLRDQSLVPAAPRSWHPALIADPREGPIDQIRAHFPLQRVVTPVPHMLQDQQPQRHFGGCLCPPARPALRMPLPLRFIHALHQSSILQQPICLPHPGFPQILDVFRQSRVPQTRSLMPQMDHSIASVTKFASDTHRHLLAQTQPPSHTKHTSFFTILRRKVASRYGMRP